MASSERPAKAGVWLMLGVVVVTGGIVALSFITRDVQVDAPHLVGSVWTASVDGAPHVYFVTDERRERRGYFDSDASYAYSVRYSIFRLHALSARDGAEAAVKTIARTDGGVVDKLKYDVSIHLIEEPEVLGAQDNVLWLWNNGLEARDLRTLELVWTREKLAELNPEFREYLPTERKYFKVLGSMRALIIKGSDARFLRVDADTGKIDLVDNAALAVLSTEHTKSAEMAFSSVQPEGKAMRNVSVSGMMCDALMDEGVWYTLLTAEQGAEMISRFGKNRTGVGSLAHPNALRTQLKRGDSPRGEVARVLFRGNYKSEPSQTTTEIFHILDQESFARAGTGSFLMGGFLRRPNGDDFWPVGDGASYLVLHRKMLGSASPWHVTRLGRDGTVHWTTSTGLADLQQVSDGQGTVICSGFADHSEPTGKRPDLMVFIDEVTGESRTVRMGVGGSQGAGE